MKIGIIQSEIRLGDVTENLKRCEIGVRSARDRGADFILLPEFFNSGIAFDKSMLSVPRRQLSTLSWLRNIASELGIPIGGSLLIFDGTDVHNTFVLIFPDGSTYTHQKDLPTMVENAYYIGGSDNGIFPTPIGRIGVALCWEMIRWQTVRRLAGRVDFVLAASCWWGRCLSPLERPEGAHRKNIEMLKNAPRDLARLLGVPVAHASGVGEYSASRLSNPESTVAGCFLGHSRIVDPDGNHMDIAKPKMGEAILVAELPGETQAAQPVPDQTGYWIPELTAAHLHRWRIDGKLGRRYYKTVARKYYSGGNADL